MYEKQYVVSSILMSLEQFSSILDFWVSYPLWVRIALFLSFFALCGAWVFVVPYAKANSPKVESQETPTESQEAPVEAQHVSRTIYMYPKPNFSDCDNPDGLPAIRFASTVDQARAISNVRPLTNQENELSIYALPKGIYGWVESFRINSPQIWTCHNDGYGPDYLVASSGAKLKQFPQFGGDIEVHKALDGVVSLVGYLPEYARISLQQSNRVEPINLTIALRMHGDFSEVVLLPRDRLLFFKSRQFGDGEAVADIRVL